MYALMNNMFTEYLNRDHVNHIYIMKICAYYFMIEVINI